MKNGWVLLVTAIVMMSLAITYGYYSRQFQAWDDAAKCAAAVTGAEQ